MQKKEIFSGVYQYSFKEGNKKYIGSSIFLDKRHNRHMSQLKNNKHPLKELQQDFNTFGLSELKYEILQYIDNKEFINKKITKKQFQDICFREEQKYLDKYYAQEYIKNREDKRFFKLLYNKSVIAQYVKSEESLRMEKEVFMYTLNGEFIESYYNSQIAELCTGIDSSSIRRVCQNIRKSAGGFLWSYEKNIIIPIYKRADTKSISQYTLDKKFIKRYNSIIDAKKETGIDIRKEKNSRLITQGEFFWLFDNEEFPNPKRTLLYDKDKVAEIQQRVKEFLKNPLQYGDTIKFIKSISDNYNISTQSAYGLLYGNTFTSR